jgi:hypothetical protein
MVRNGHRLGHISRDFTAWSVLKHDRYHRRGGGIFEHDVFYTSADQFGLLLLHDMQFAGALQPGLKPPIVDGGHRPAFPGSPAGVNATRTLESEIQYQIRRLSHHPSIAVWSGCNGDGGCEQVGRQNWVMTVVAAEDKSRPFQTSSPSDGWASGVQQLNGLPSEQPLVARGWSASSHDGTGAYAGLGGADWPSYNTWIRPYANTSDLMELFTPPMMSTAWVAQVDSPRAAAANHASFVTEFGCVGWSSFESYSATIPENDWSLHSPSSFYRNWPADAVVQSYWGTGARAALSETGEAALRSQLFQSMLSARACPLPVCCLAHGDSSAITAQSLESTI